MTSGVRQESGLDLRMDPPREVTVARQHRDREGAVLGDGLVHGWGEGARVADAGRAAVADDAEPDGCKVVEKPCAGQIPLRSRGARREGGLHPRGWLEAELPGFPGQEPCRDGQARVGRVSSS